MTNRNESNIFYYELDFGNHKLIMFGGDERISDEDIRQRAELLVAGWNHRHEARNCEHQWGEQYAMHPLVFGPGVINRRCVKCGTDELAWKHQQREEAIQ